MADRPGCLGGLLSLPLRLLNLGRGHQKLLQSRTPPPRGLLTAEAAAMQRARQAAAQCDRILHGAGDIDPAVLDQVGGTVRTLLDRIDDLASRIAAARQWLAANDPERIRRELVDLELSDAGSVVDRMASQKALRQSARHAAAVEAGLPGLAGKLTAAAHQLEALAAKLTAQQLDAAGLLADLKRQEAVVERAVSAWQATVDEVAGLSG